MQGYGYVLENPVNLVDPSGLIPPPPGCEFGEICHGAPLGPYSPTSVGGRTSRLAPMDFAPPEGFWTPQSPLFDPGVGLLFKIPWLPRRVDEVGVQIAPSCLVGTLGIEQTLERHYADPFGRELLYESVAWKADYGVGPDVPAVGSATIGGNINLQTGEHEGRLALSLSCFTAEYRRGQLMAGCQEDVGPVGMTGLEWGKKGYQTFFWYVTSWSYYSSRGGTRDHVPSEFRVEHGILPGAELVDIVTYSGGYQALADRIRNLYGMQVFLIGVH